MKCCGRFPFMFLGAVVAGALVIAGCSKDSNQGKVEKKEEKKSVDKGAGESVTPAGVGPVAGKGTGTLKGRVTYVGDAPQVRSLKADMEKQKDKERCLMGDTNVQTWKIGADKGVQYAVVWLRPLHQDKGAYFQLTDAQKTQKEPVKIDQPYCQFEPHVVGVFPDYFDGKEQKATGQVLEVLNDAPMPHNTKWAGEKSYNKGNNEIIAPKGQMKVNARPGAKSKPGEDVITLNCNLHGWMKGYAWVFDHPFFAVTDKDGNYEIKGVPTGVELEVVHWHETFKAPQAEKATLKDGDNTKNFEIPTK